MAVARSVVFSPVGGEGIVEMAVRRLGEAIAVGLIETGEQLPSESELAARLGIATVSLREALAVLSGSGYVETRRGRGGGTFVRRPALRPTGSSSSRVEGHLRKRSTAELRDLCEFQLAVSGAAASLAAVRRSEAEARELTALAAEMDELAEEALFRRADSRFHIAITGAAQSPRMVALETSLQAELIELLAGAPEAAGPRTSAIAEHREIALAIRRQDPHMARAITQRHVLQMAAGLQTATEASTEEARPDR